jgi:asparagine synthase (glutamine-hydrolysing)
MCGIAGIASFRNSPPPHFGQVKAMCDVLVHRGPDEEGIDVRDGVALGMRRLSVIDLAGGKQPIYNEDGTIRIVFNGEIYNYRELRKELQMTGHVFRTNSDTETILHAYEENGDNFPNKLNGMFAFALHDMKKRRLILARDHIGIKPLYYSINRDHLVWGSEIKAILANGLVERKLDVDALGEFMAWEYIPGTRTLFQSIFKLAPGEMIQFDLDSPSFRSSIYWDVPDSDRAMIKSDKEWLEVMDAKIRDCVRRQLVSDVPLGSFLSGGVDSSIIVSAMGNARAFSIGFDDPSYNELQWARKVADHLRIDHLTEVIKPDIFELFKKLMYFMDDPIGDFSIFPTYLVSKLARRHVTVALSGDGGDELFGGYETYVAEQKAKQYSHIPGLIRKNLIEPAVRSLRPSPAKKGLVNKAKRFVEGIDHDEGLSHARWRIFCGENIRKEIFTDDALKKITTPVSSHILELFRRAGDRHPIDKSLYVDLKSYLCDDILVKVDRMSMAVSLETRVPYLDTELVSLAFSMPHTLKVASGKTKILLKKVAAMHIPKECIYRPKEGFSIPIKHWLATDLRPLMEECLGRKAIEDGGLFRMETVARLKREHLEGRCNHSHILWSLIVFESWKKRWLAA